MNKIKKLCIVPFSILLLGSYAEASMLDQLIYNVAGQATNAAGARLGDEIYYGSSGSGSSSSGKVHHKKRHKAKKRRQIVPVDTSEMKIQRALSSLGFYHGRIDGEINSFETRSAIKNLNIAYGISNSASLLPQEKDSLIFLGTLFNFDRYLISRGGDKISKGKKIQTALKVHGFYSSKIDGAVGPGTRRSIGEYKASIGQSYGNSLDFEEEYQLVSSAKEMNDKNIEDTINSLKALGTQQRVPMPAPVAYKVQRPIPQQNNVMQQQQQPMEQRRVVQEPMQTVQSTTQITNTTKQVIPHIQQSTSTMPEASSIEMYTDK